MYPHPPPGPSSTPQAPLTIAPVGAQSYAHLSSINPTAQHNSQLGDQSIHQGSHQLPSASKGQTHLPPSTVLPPPPPLSLNTSQGQALYGQTPPVPMYSFPISPRNLRTPGVPPPPSHPPASSSLYLDPAFNKGLAAKHVAESVPSHGTVLGHEEKGCSKMVAIAGDGGLSKANSIHDESSPPRKTREPGSPLFADSDMEMEDDITQPNNELALDLPSGAPLCGSDLNPGALFNKEQLPVHHYSAETSSITGALGDIQRQAPGYYTSSLYAQLRHEKDDDGSREASSSPNTGRAMNVLESVGGDMYDPFVDSFEPSPNLSKKSSHVQEHKLACESDIVPTLSISSNRPPDVEENNKGNDEQVFSDSGTMPWLSICSNSSHNIKENDRGQGVEPVIAATSVDDEECGENADGHAEGDSIETGSPNSPDKVGGSNAKASEVENGGKKSQEKGKDKESRSMRLFKIVLTQFVKDLLKPSWRQGNMSKEAFKTIVKKTVDKVSGTMEGRRVPKSRAKIDRYIDSSQHKLTKLVMGYVDKYVKA